MPALIRRPLPLSLAYVATVALTAALLILCSYLQPAAPIHLWFLFGLLGVAIGGIVGGAAASALAAVGTVLAVDFVAIPPVATFKLPHASADILALGAFVAASAVTARLSHLRYGVHVERTRAELASRRLARETRQREFLLRLSERALTGGRLDALCRNATEVIVDALGVRYCAILESQADARTLTVAASAGWSPAAVEGLTIEANADSHVGYALFAREPVVTVDASAEHRFAVPTELRRHGARSGIAVRIGAVRPFGVVVAYDTSPRTFDEADIQFVCGMAAMLAAAYERSRLDEERVELVARDEVRREEAQVAARRATFLAQTATVLDAALEPETTLVSLARLAVPAIADCAVVDLVKEDGRVQRIEVVDIDPIRRQDAEALRRLAPDLRTEGPFPRAIRTGQPVLLPELTKVATHSPADAEHLRLFARLGCQSVLLIPLVARGQTLGLLTLGSRVPYGYQGADLSLAQELAGRAAMALDNGRLHREAQAASRAKDEFLAMVSHELRTPLNAVLGWAAILRTHPLDEARARHALDAIDRSVRAQAQLLEQLLDISRIVAGKFELHLTRVQLSEVIESATDAVRPAAEEKRIRLEKRLDAGVPIITGDPDRLHQVVVNLLSNAIKFTPDDGLVEVELRPVNHTSAEILVRDRGIGIKSEFLPYVFERFRQSGAPAGSLNQGLGLGLSIVRDIVEKHGGTVVAESAGEGKGAIFRVSLPLGAPPEPVGVRRGDPAGAREPLFRTWTPERRP